MAEVGRIEVVRVSAEGLRDFRTRLPRVSFISPGEPLHVMTARDDERAPAVETVRFVNAVAEATRSAGV